MTEMLTPTARICLHADVDGDPARCPCFVPPGMKAEDWEAANGDHYRVLTSEGEDAWVFAIQNADGTIDAATVVHAHLDEEFTAEDARRIGQSLLRAAAKLDALLAKGWAGDAGMGVKLAADEIDALNGVAL